MGISLSDFKSAVKDVARPNRFELYLIPHPNVFSSGVAGISLNSIGGIASAVGTVKSAISAGSGALDMPYFVKGINLPGRVIGQVEHKRYGVSRKFPGDPSWNDLTITFIGDTAWTARSLIDLWMDFIVDSDVNNRGSSNHVASGSRCILNPIDGKGKIITSYMFNDIWPKEVSDVDLNRESTDQALEFTVTFAYNTWTKVF